MANLSLLKELAKYLHLKLSIMPFTESVSEKKERKCSSQIYFDFSGSHVMQRTPLWRMCCPTR